MPRKRSTPPQDLRHRWYVAEWAVHLKKSQADAQRDMGWPKSNTSALWNNKQRYTQNLIDQVAGWLGIEPFELLMPPSRALALRNLHKSAHLIVAEDQGAPFEHDHGASERSSR